MKLSTDLTDKELYVLEQEIEKRECLPHLYGLSLYKWQHDFINSTNRDTLLCSGNQLGKSACQIIKCIKWATEPSLWPKLWVRSPRTFWYLYPSLKLATMEYNEKWVKEFLPRGKYKEDPVYGWKPLIKNDVIQSISFNSGVTLYFMSYSQREADIQAMTVNAVFTDEELPQSFYSELQARLRAVRGYFSMVFTATIGQEFWRAAIEEKGNKETFKDAWKRQVSIYDCRRYADGTPSQWTTKRIREEIARCGSEREIKKRMYGRFIKDDGSMMYPAFNEAENVVPTFIIPNDWKRYGAVDCGGGVGGHPAAIAFIAVSPKFDKGVVYKCWRGDNVLTTSADILNKFIVMRGSDKLEAQYYDHANKDFFIVASRDNEEYFEPADKSHASGEAILNTLFKFKMLYIIGDDDGMKAVHEFSTVSHAIDKKHAHDDLVDAIRYASTGIPWNFNNVGRTIVQNEVKIIEPVLNDRDKMIQDKRNGTYVDSFIDQEYVNNEIMEANECYEA